MSNFRLLKKDNETQARIGVLSTAHGKIETPSYVIVATHGKIKCLSPADIKKTGTQVIISNTYHLWEKALNDRANVHRLLGHKIPIMTDSGGFQVFSLGFGGKNKIGKVLSENTKKSKIKRQNIKITDRGVCFMLDGKKRFLGPELSMKIQKKLGADIIFAFDECTSPLDNFSYNKRALERTHRWAKKCLSLKSNNQMLMGIVQGGKYKSLRQKSAKFIGSLPFDGFGIGGSFGKDEMVETLKWVVPYLPEEKPRHLLGIGRVQDIFNAVENGVDLFDCVIPTREARHGRLWTRFGPLDIKKSKYSEDKNQIEKGCTCPTCRKTTRTQLHELFKNNLPKAQRLATLHNIWFFNNLMSQIRTSIQKGKFKEFKKKFLGSFK